MWQPCRVNQLGAARWSLLSAHLSAKMSLYNQVESKMGGFCFPLKHLLHHTDISFTASLFLCHYCKNYLLIHRCMGGTPRSWVCMPRRKQPVYVMEDCGGTPVFEVVLQMCWSMRKTPVQSVNVSDDYATSPKSVFRHVVKVRPKRCSVIMSQVALECLCGRLCRYRLYENMDS